MPTRSFDFTGAAGQRLAARLDTPDLPARAWAVFAHCFTCSKNSLAATRVARALTARGIGVLRFDFTGLGGSEGEFGAGGFSADVADLQAAVAHMREHDMAPALLVGHSLGGAAVLAAAGSLPSVRAVAVIGAPFDVMHVTGQFGAQVPEILERGEARVDLGGRPFTVRRQFIEDLRTHDQGARIAALDRALLVLHSPRDATVGIDNAAAIFQAARHPKSFVSLDTADHLLTVQEDAGYVADVVAAWAGRYLPELAEAAGADAQASERAEVAETGAGRFQLVVDTAGAHFLADEPPGVGGLGSGPNPFGLLSSALAACTAMTLRMYAERKGWPLGRTRVAVAHHRGEGGRSRFERDIVLSGALDAEQRARLVEIAERCPVHRTLTEGADIVTREDAGGS
ncbi:bifunctional alpha/beta hydrolase/OsmC family protein [Coralloluteibacterium stylophorae]|uniref:Alpha/beta fold hydrolase n=1 Tax=Coralloluteibacterium stylophorae TaxID=1776034 RepID=A0A8J7VVR7_9GAMM|nr:alpha/beta fold hydrolase [Coralloluteibacterium stylophorae]MBS7457415.1 alpha/beta fold hydrolase [Coralloluteibacterium stylophorae]